MLALSARECKCAGRLGRGAGPIRGGRTLRPLGRDARHDRGVPRDDPRDRGGGRRARSGPASWSAWGCPRRRCRSRSAGWSSRATPSCAATAACDLTDKGRALATTVVRRHRLAERLLVDVIGLEWEKVHREADRWEHAISADVEEKLVVLLGDPATCPHGNPIPGSGHRVDAQAWRRRPSRWPSRAGCGCERISEKARARRRRAVAARGQRPDPRSGGRGAEHQRRGDPGAARRRGAGGAARAWPASPSSSRCRRPPVSRPRPRGRC